MTSTTSSQTHITVQQLSQVTQQLLTQGRLADARQVICAFIQQGQIDFGAVKLFLDAALARDAQDELKPVLQALKKGFSQDVRTWKVTYLAEHGMRNWNGALKALDRCEALEPVTEDMCIARANAHERLLQPEKALAALDGIEPQSLEEQARTLFIRTNALEQLKQKSKARELLEAFLPDAGDHTYVVGCWKELGKLRNGAGDYDAAFAAFKAGNEMNRRLANPSISTNSVRQRIEVARTLYTPEWVASWQPVPKASRTPVFLVGFPRSGTTLLEQMLDAHPDIVALEERGTVEQMWGVANTMMRTLDKLANPKPAQLGWKENECRIQKQLATLTGKQIEALRETYYKEVSRYVSWKKGQVFVDKMPMNLYNTGFIKRIFPEAKFILALRHPADCVLSAYSQPFELNPAMDNMLDLEWAASLYGNMFRLFHQFQDVLSMNDSVFAIRYEDVITNFKEQVSGLLHFLGVEWDDNVASYADHARNRGSLGTPSYQGVTQQLYGTSVGRWRHYYPHLQPVLPHFREAAARYGYELMP